MKDKIRLSQWCSQTLRFRADTGCTLTMATMSEPPIDDSNSTIASPVLSPTPSSRPIRPTRDIPQPPYTELTALRAHYLKKSLVQLQFARELDQISSSGPSDVSTLSYLGPPFTPPPQSAAPLDLPFLRYIFRQFVLTFPFLAAAPKDFYSQKLQPFVAAVLARNISPTSVLDDGPAEQATRKRLLAKVERNLSLFVGAATKLVEHEDVVRLSQVDLDRLEMLAQKRQAKLAKARDYFEVNITCVRTVVDKGRMRSRVHEVSILPTFVPDPSVHTLAGIHSTD